MHCKLQSEFFTVKMSRLFDVPSVCLWCPFISIDNCANNVLIMGRKGTPRSTEMERYYKEGLADLLAVDVNIRLNFGRKYWAKFFYLFVSKPYISNFSH